MRTKNHFELRGYVGNQPEIRTTEKSKKVVSLRIATNENFTNKKSGEPTKTTDWHTVSLWEKKAEIAEKYINKGALIAVEGRIKPRSYEGKEGAKVYTIDLVVDTLAIILNKEED